MSRFGKRIIKAAAAFAACMGIAFFSYVPAIAIDNTSPSSVKEPEASVKDAGQVEKDDKKASDSIEDYIGGKTKEDLLKSTETDESTGDEYDKVPGDGGLSEVPKSADKNDWNLILVNKQNPVPEDYVYNLTDLGDGQQADKRIKGYVTDLLEAAKKDGIELVICSAYRSIDRQTTLFNNKIDKYMKEGMNYYDAFRNASFSVTVPGTSEHQLGLALDIITPDYTDLDSGFAETEAGKWLKENAADYGFILRYPEGKEYITGIIFEPWHFRYVGIENAKYITGHGLVLEEYLDLF